MKKKPKNLDDYDMLPEYDWSKSRRNPYAGALKGDDVVVVVLDDDLAKAFPTAAKARRALRAAMRASRGRRKLRPSSRRKSA